MAQDVSLDDVRRALETRASELPEFVLALARAPIQKPQNLRSGAVSWWSYKRELTSWGFKRKSPTDKAHLRQERMTALEADRAEIPLPDRLSLHQILLELWADNSPRARAALLRIVAEVPLVWGPWRAIKRIFKEAEAREDDQMLGALTARFDAAYARYSRSEVSSSTLGYLARRGWRALRRRAEQLPATYADAAAAVLRWYPDNTNWPKTWVANHVLFHDTRRYGRHRFQFWRVPEDTLSNRAYAELWQRSPRPLFGLLESARSEHVRKYAVAALRRDFRAALREVEPEWVARLAGVRSTTVGGFVVWILSNVPRFEQRAFRELGLHEAVLTLLESPSLPARDYAAAYARTHARDLDLETLLRLANNDRQSVRKLAGDLLGERNPRTQVGLEAWGRLLGTRHAHNLATESLRKHFGARELTPAWFAERMLSGDRRVFSFASELLGRIHKHQTLGAEFFKALLDDPRVDASCASFALGALKRFEVSELGLEFLRVSLLQPRTRATLQSWVEEERVPAPALGTDFLKALAYHPAWEASAWVSQLRASGRPWAANLSFDAALGKQARKWLGDVRKFSPRDVGLEWLLELVQRAEPAYPEFAIAYLVRAFAPVDFAQTSAESGPVTLDDASFLFTGKLASMTRARARTRVADAGGRNASSVTRNLTWLVVGDEGSPLFGDGRKGRKQLKAEQLIADGAEIRIISETDFSRMLTGGPAAPTPADGCARLWEMALGSAATGNHMDAPLARFAIRYIRHHHPDVALTLGGEGVETGMEIPRDFLAWERVRPLLSDSRQPLRVLALELARWELARWNPPAAELVALCEQAHPDVRSFLADALLADEDVRSQPYRLDAERWDPADVYRFCESLDSGTRDLGMKLIARYPRFAIPEELFRLSESPDRQVQAFVIRVLWSHYRHRGTTDGWSPAAAGDRDVGPGAPSRPEKLPADLTALRAFLRQVLFSLPPGRLPSVKGGRKLKPLPARLAKLGLVEVLRDLAVEDSEVAEALLPVLIEFMDSRGRSEHAACLVAITRIRAAHSSLQQ